MITLLLSSLRRKGNTDWAFWDGGFDAFLFLAVMGLQLVPVVRLFSPRFPAYPLQRRA